jgi:hypothetical protein
MSEAGTTALDEFNATFSRYLVWTKKGQGPATEDRARKVRFELFKQFKAIAKNAAGLRAEIEARDFHISRRKDASGKTVDTDTEIALRIRSLRFLSVSWIFQAWRLRAGGQIGAFASVSRHQQQIGEAIVNTAEGTETPSVSITSFLQGVLVQNRERNLVDAALKTQAADMGEYIARKHQEWLQGVFSGRTFNVSIPLRLA